MTEIVLRDRSSRPVLGVTDDLQGLDFFGRGFGIGPSTSTVSVQTDADTVEKVLASFTLKGGTLSRNSQRLKIRAFGLNGATANVKNYRIRVGGLGGTVIVARSSSGNATGWELEALIYRLTQVSQRSFGRSDTGIGGTISAINTPTTFDLDTDLVIVLTGQNNVAAAGDIIFQAWELEIAG